MHDAMIEAEGALTASLEDSDRAAASRPEAGPGAPDRAAESIARFRELESKHFADYYLVGTLTSLLVAIASGILVRCVVGR
jgi:hypothetical protein